MMIGPAPMIKTECISVCLGMRNPAVDAVMCGVPLGEAPNVAREARALPVHVSALGHKSKRQDETRKTVEMKGKSRIVSPGTFRPNLIPQILGQT